MIRFSQLQNAFAWAAGRRHAVARTLVVVVALALVAGFVAVRQFAAPTYAGPITVTVKPLSLSPNPVLVGAHATASLSAYYTPPSGVPEGQLSASYDWSIGDVQYKALQAGTFGAPPANSYTDSISPAQPSSNSAPAFAFTPLIAGYWEVSVGCSATVTDSQTNQYWSGSATAGPRGLTSATVTFSPNPITTGADKITGDADKIYVPVTATVQPADLVDSVGVGNFVNSGTGRAAVDNVENNHPTTGQIQFHLYGTAGTSATSPNGDIEMEAKDGSTVLGTAEVTVVIPADIGRPHPTFSGAVAPSDLALNSKTTPAAPGVPANQELLVTAALKLLTMPVVDQFGKPLNRVYDGAPVDEQTNGSWVPINQNISASGTYQDPVGVAAVGNEVPWGNPQNFPWPTLTSPQGPESASVPVEVAGFQLNPGIVNRNVGYNNGTLTITWP